MKHFYMGDSYREYLITANGFYLEQAKKRLLCQFDNIAQEVTQYAEKWREKRLCYFDPDKHDPDDFDEGLSEEALEEGGVFYTKLKEMQLATYLSVVAGMFYQWDKEFRKWMVEGVNNDSLPQGVRGGVWNIGLFQLIKFCNNFKSEDEKKWDITSKNYFNTLNKYRLIVNVYKHGNGDSLEELKTQHPEFIEILGLDSSLFLKYAGYSNLKIKKEDIKELSKAIEDFWKGVPERLFIEDNIVIPKKFVEALNKFKKEKRHHDA